MESCHSSTAAQGICSAAEPTQTYNEWADRHDLLMYLMLGFQMFDSTQHNPYIDRPAQQHFCSRMAAIASHAGREQPQQQLQATAHKATGKPEPGMIPRQSQVR